MRLFLVRHGETLYNTEYRYTGQSDVPLSEPGEQQAAAVGQRLASEHLDVIVSSDLQRARATAEAIARYHNLPVEEDADLREIALGEWEGSTYAEIKQRYPDLLERWRSDPAVYAPPGGEKVTDLQERVVRALSRWRSRYPEATVLWATHGGAIEVLLCYVLDVDLSRRWEFGHPNAAITELDLTSDGVRVLHLKDTSHLS